MKSLLILGLGFALLFALFFTRPTQANFENYVRMNTKVIDGQPTGGQTVAAKIGEQLHTFVADTANHTAADVYLDQCTFQNRVLWTNVIKDGQVIYTGALNHWFERAPADASRRKT